MASWEISNEVRPVVQSVLDLPLSQKYKQLCNISLTAVCLLFVGCLVAVLLIVTVQNTVCSPMVCKPINIFLWFYACLVAYY